MIEHLKCPHFKENSLKQQQQNNSTANAFTGRVINWVPVRHRNSCYYFLMDLMYLGCTLYYLPTQTRVNLQCLFFRLVSIFRTSIFAVTIVAVVIVHVWSVFTLEYRCACTYEGRSWCWMSSTLLSAAWSFSLSGPRAINSARLAGQWAQGMHLSPFSS